MFVYNIFGSDDLIIVTPCCVCASGVKQLVLSVVVVVCRCRQKFFLTADSEAITISKREDKDEMSSTLAYMYLVEHKAVLLLVSSTFF